MSTHSVIVVAETWLYEKLHGDATLATAGVTGEHSEMAKEGSVLPYIVYANLTTGDVSTVNAARIMTTLDYLVRVVGDGASLKALGAIAARIDTLLHKSSGNPTTGGTVLSCVRLRPVSYAERVSGKAGGQYRHLGGVYRLNVQE